MSTLRAAGTISALTLVSRVLGLVRDSLMASVLGAGWAAGTFLLAWTFPNLLRRLLGEGALSAAFLPAYAGTLKTGGPAAARSLLASVSGTVLTILSLLVAVVVTCSLLLPPSWFPEPSEAGGTEAIALLLVLNAILFPYTVPVCLSALYSGAMNAHRRFALPAALPVVLNLFWIAGLLLAGPFGITVDRDVALFVAWFLLAGGLAQLGVVVWPLMRRGALARPPLALIPKDPRARAVFAVMGPTVIGMSLVQINAMLDQFLAYYLVAPGAPTYVYLANRLLLFPHALTAMAVAVAVFPRLAEMASVADKEGLRRTLDRSASASLFITLPAAVGLLLIAGDVVHVLFEHGEFTAADATQTTWTTICVVAGLPMIGLAQLYARAFYSVGDTRTPSVQAAWLVLVNLILNLVFVLGLGMGTAGLATATSITAAMNAGGLALRLRRHIPAARGLFDSWIRCGAGTAVMALAVWLARPEVGDAGRWTVLGWRVALPVGVAIVVYFGVMRLLRAPELSLLRRRPPE